MQNQWEEAEHNRIRWRRTVNLVNNDNQKVKSQQSNETFECSGCGTEIISHIGLLDHRKTHEMLPA